MSTPVTDLSELQSWLARLQYAVVRDLESVQPALLPNGRRLRGVRLTPNIVLGRDRCFYLMDEEGNAMLIVNPLKWATAAELRSGYEHAVNEHRARRRASGRMHGADLYGT
jgi:hypothetical protein